MARETLEDRVALLEKEVMRLQVEKEPEHTPPGEKRGWRWFVGVFADSPDFEDVVKTGEAWRSHDRPSEGENKATPSAKETS